MKKSAAILLCWLPIKICNDDPGVPKIERIKKTMNKFRLPITPALGESTDRQTELEIILQHSIPRVYTSP